MNYLHNILKQCADFRATIITCRSQFFLGEEHIPRETSFPRVVPRGLGQGNNFVLTRGFIAPFNRHQIDRYIRSHFPRWNPLNYYSRQKAYKLARDIPDLSYRPMLLERLPYLIGNTETAIELFDLYDVLVEGWIKREDSWINSENLRNVSLELALYIYNKSLSDVPRINVDEVRKVAELSLGKNPEWEHLHSRSLLNRDSQGRFKFAHRSILEFLIVKLAVRGDLRPLEVPRTPFMKELLVSWGHARNDKESAALARAILVSDSGKKNIAPLYDMWTAPPALELPDFSRAAQRRIAFTGDRLAPHTWRSSAIVLENPVNPEVWEIHDTEFNLRWQLIDNVGFRAEGITENYNDLISVVSSCGSRQLPSYDQFLSLVDGLFHAGRDALIPEGDCFLLADQPESGVRLVARLGKNLDSNSHLEIKDKERRVGVTNRYVSAYLTGINVSLTYTKNLKVRQLWLLAR